MEKINITKMLAVILLALFLMSPVSYAQGFDILNRPSKPEFEVLQATQPTFYDGVITIHIIDKFDRRRVSEFQIDVNGMYPQGVVHIFEYDYETYRVIREFSTGEEFYVVDSNEYSILDLDNDGIITKEEQQLGTNPDLPDTDYDSFTDGEEVILGTDPKARFIVVQKDSLVKVFIDSGVIDPDPSIVETTVPGSAFIPPDSFILTTFQVDSTKSTLPLGKVLSSFSYNNRNYKVLFKSSENSLDELMEQIYKPSQKLILRLTRFKFLIIDDAIYDDRTDSDGDGMSDGLEEYILKTDPKSRDYEDMDNDKLTNLDELNIYGTNPLLQDSDGDQLTDGKEVIYGIDHFDPTKWDTDGNGINDRLDDQDNDKLPTYFEAYDKVEDLEFGTHPLNPDTDGDGILDGADDRDEDGLTDFEEFEAGTFPYEADSDYDGLTDYQELKIYKTNPLRWDTDEDGWGDGEELHIYNTDPTKEDTDGDGVSDDIDPEPRNPEVSSLPISVDYAFSDYKFYETSCDLPEEIPKFIEVEKIEFVSGGKETELDFGEENIYYLDELVPTNGNKFVLTFSGDLKEAEVEKALVVEQPYELVDEFESEIIDAIPGSEEDVSGNQITINLPELKTSAKHKFSVRAKVKLNDVVEQDFVYKTYLRTGASDFSRDTIVIQEEGGFYFPELFELESFAGFAIPYRVKIDIFSNPNEQRIGREENRYYYADFSSFKSSGNFVADEFKEYPATVKGSELENAVHYIYNDEKSWLYYPYEDKFYETDLKSKLDDTENILTANELYNIIGLREGLILVDDSELQDFMDFANSEIPQETPPTLLTKSNSEIQGKTLNFGFNEISFSDEKEKTLSFQDEETKAKSEYRDTFERFGDGIKQIKDELDEVYGINSIKNFEKEISGETIVKTKSSSGQVTEIYHISDEPKSEFAIDHDFTPITEISTRDLGGGVISTQSRILHYNERNTPIDSMISVRYNPEINSDQISKVNLLTNYYLNEEKRSISDETKEAVPRLWHIYKVARVTKPGKYPEKTHVATATDFLPSGVPTKFIFADPNRLQTIIITLDDIEKKIKEGKYDWEKFLFKQSDEKYGRGYGNLPDFVNRLRRLNAEDLVKKNPFLALELAKGEGSVRATFLERLHGSNIRFKDGELEVPIDDYVLAFLPYIGLIPLKKQFTQEYYKVEESLKSTIEEMHWLTEYTDKDYYGEVGLDPNYLDSKMLSLFDRYQKGVSNLENLQHSYRVSQFNLVTLETVLFFVNPIKLAAKGSKPYLAKILEKIRRWTPEEALRRATIYTEGSVSEGLKLARGKGYIVIRTSAGKTVQQILSPDEALPDNIKQVFTREDEQQALQAWFESVYKKRQPTQKFSETRILERVSVAGLLVDESKALKSKSFVNSFGPTDQVAEEIAAMQVRPRGTLPGVILEGKSGLSVVVNNEHSLDRSLVSVKGKEINVWASSYGDRLSAAQKLLLYSALLDGANLQLMRQAEINYIKNILKMKLRLLSRSSTFNPEDIINPDLIKPGNIVFILNKFIENLETEELVTYLRTLSRNYLDPNSLKLFSPEEITYITAENFASSTYKELVFLTELLKTNPTLNLPEAWPLLSEFRSARKTGFLSDFVLVNNLDKNSLKLLALLDEALNCEDVKTSVITITRDIYPLIVLEDAAAQSPGVNKIIKYAVTDVVEGGGQRLDSTTGWMDRVAENRLASEFTGLVPRSSKFFENFQSGRLYDYDEISNFFNGRNPFELGEDMLSGFEKATRRLDFDGDRYVVQRFNYEFTNAEQIRKASRSELAMRTIIRDSYFGFKIKTPKAVSYQEGGRTYIISEFVTGDNDPEFFNLVKVAPEIAREVEILQHVFGLGDTNIGNLIKSGENRFVIDMTYSLEPVNIFADTPREAVLFTDTIKDSIYEPWFSRKEYNEYDFYRSFVNKWRALSVDPRFDKKIRDALQKAGFTEDEINIIHGIIKLNIRNLETNLRDRLIVANKVYGLSAPNYRISKFSPSRGTMDIIKLLHETVDLPPPVSSSEFFPIPVLGELQHSMGVALERAALAYDTAPSNLQMGRDALLANLANDAILIRKGLIDQTTILRRDHQLFSAFESLFEKFIKLREMWTNEVNDLGLKEPVLKEYFSKPEKVVLISKDIIDTPDFKRSLRREASNDPNNKVKINNLMQLPLKWEVVGKQLRDFYELRLGFANRNNDPIATIFFEKDIKNLLKIPSDKQLNLLYKIHVENILRFDENLLRRLQITLDELGVRSVPQQEIFDRLPTSIIDDSISISLENDRTALFNVFSISNKKWQPGNRGDFIDIYNVGNKGNIVRAILIDSAGHGPEGAQNLGIYLKAHLESNMHVGGAADDLIPYLNFVNEKLLSDADAIRGLIAQERIPASIQYIPSTPYAAFEINPITGEMTYSAKGPTYLFVVSNSGVVRRLETGPFMLGAVKGINFETGTITLSNGDKVIAVTDGVLAALRPDVKSPETTNLEILETLLRSNSRQSVNNIKKAIKLEIAKQTSSLDEFPDDWSFVIYEHTIKSPLDKILERLTLYGTPELQAIKRKLTDLYEETGIDVRLTGGNLRNSIFGEDPFSSKDIDLTITLPEKYIDTMDLRETKFGSKKPELGNKNLYQYLSDEVFNELPGGLKGKAELDVLKINGKTTRNLEELLIDQEGFTLDQLEYSLALERIDGNIIYWEDAVQKTLKLGGLERIPQRSTLTPRQIADILLQNKPETDFERLALRMIRFATQYSNIEIDTLTKKVIKEAIRGNEYGLSSASGRLDELVFDIFSTTKDPDTAIKMLKDLGMFRQLKAIGYNFNAYKKYSLTKDPNDLWDAVRNLRLGTSNDFKTKLYRTAADYNFEVEFGRPPYGYLSTKVIQKLKGNIDPSRKIFKPFFGPGAKGKDQIIHEAIIRGDLETAEVELAKLDPIAFPKKSMLEDLLARHKVLRTEQYKFVRDRFYKMTTGEQIEFLRAFENEIGIDTNLQFPDFVGRSSSQINDLLRQRPDLWGLREGNQQKFKLIVDDFFEIKEWGDPELRNFIKETVSSIRATLRLDVDPDFWIKSELSKVQTVDDAFKSLKAFNPITNRKINVRLKSLDDAQKFITKILDRRLGENYKFASDISERFSSTKYNGEQVEISNDLSGGIKQNWEYKDGTTVITDVPPHINLKINIEPLKKLKMHIFVEGILTPYNL